MAIYFIGDTHFDDKNIIDFANRPFKNVVEMNNHIVNEWNSVVKKNDIVYIVGDFISENYKNDTISLINKLNGFKILIRGNHDTMSDEKYHNFGIDKIYDHPIILENFYIISHDAMYVNDSMPYVNIFAHVHNNPIYKDYGKHHFCVSVERPAMKYVPIQFNKIKEIIKGEYV